MYILRQDVRQEFLQGGGPHIQNQCASNNNSDHHCDGDPSLIIIRTQPLGISRFINSDYHTPPLLLFLLFRGTFLLSPLKSDQKVPLTEQ